MDKLNKELESAGGCPSGAKEIKIDHEEGFVTAELASTLSGYPEGEAEKAQKEKAERQAQAEEAHQGSEDVDPRRDPNENKRKEG